MQKPLQITFRNLPHSDAIEAKVRQQVAKLENLCDRIQRCRVVIDAPHQHHYKGQQYQITIDLTVPNEEIVINREPTAHQAHQNCYVAIRDAFAAARRQLKTYVSRQRHLVKSHQVPPHGRIVDFHPSEGYGFIETSDGEAIYFHANSLLNGDHKQLAVGTEVRFALEVGEKGPQASTVQLVGKHHIVG
ncbi:MAG: HPF/RaiA family ribosome-associated protein [Cyanobacteria bacterium P01_F01_bin.4]